MASNDDMDSSNMKNDKRSVIASAYVVSQAVPSAPPDGVSVVLMCFSLRGVYTWNFELLLEGYPVGYAEVELRIQKAIGVASEEF